jgi:hypothetical protein
MSAWPSADIITTVLPAYSEINKRRPVHTDYYWDRSKNRHIPEFRIYRLPKGRCIFSKWVYTEYSVEQ